jgi:hypothetical protein
MILRRRLSRTAPRVEKAARVMTGGLPCSDCPDHALRKNMMASTMITMTTTVPRPIYMANSSF